MESESVDEEKLKTLAQLKSFLANKISELEGEIRTLRLISGFFDEQLAAKSFRTVAPAPSAKVSPQVGPQPETGMLRSIRSKTGRLLATAQVSPVELRVSVNPELQVSQESRPFSSFLVGKILQAMASRDVEMIQTGELQPGTELTYEIMRDGDFVKEILVRNYKNDTRLREIINAVRWTLDTVMSSTQ